jgi:hypothetical protein
MTAPAALGDPAASATTTPPTSAARRPAPTTQDGGGPAEQLRAQTHALRRIADLLDRLGQHGLALSVSGVDDRLSLQVPSDLGDEQARRSTVAAFASAVGATATPRPGRVVSYDWFAADGQLAGHPIHIYTPINQQGTDQ